ncbi:hypothetical protein [Streptomyces sp. NPDC051016]|uniref:hypothetical protein n=1 Tax=Streptomyces sp. NPDC051016 TaxID=3365638 RepID=UPI003788124D
MTEPLNPEREQDIRTRARAATPGPWEPYAKYGPTFFANISGPYLQGVGDFNFGEGEQAEADEAFVRHAREDVDALLAEIDRMRAAHTQEIDDALRAWAVKIREVGTAKGWSTWAGAFIDPDVEFVETGMPTTESIVAELRRLDREATLREAADAITEVIEADRAKFPRRSNDRAALGGAREIVLGLIDQPRRTADEVQREKDTSDGSQPTVGESTAAHGRVEPLTVSRFDVAIEPAPEEEPVFTVGAIADDGRPVALLFDPETRQRVAGWLAPEAAESAALLPHVASFEIEWPGKFRELLIQRSYVGGDRWAICDREGRRWERGYGFAYEGLHLDERTRTDTRFPLAEAWPLAHQIAADETAARAIHRTHETVRATSRATDTEGPSQ